MDGQRKATVYTAPWCQACKKAVIWLGQHGIEVEVLGHEKAPFPVKSLPTIVFDGHVLRGFDPRQLLKLIK